MKITARQAAERHGWSWRDMTDDERDESAEHAYEGGCEFCDPAQAD